MQNGRKIKVSKTWLSGDILEHKSRDSYYLYNIKHVIIIIIIFIFIFYFLFFYQCSLPTAQSKSLVDS